MRAKVDAYGFFCGLLHESVAAAASANGAVLADLPPETRLGEFQQWKLVGSAWVAAPDYRGHLWYDPLNAEAVHKPQAPDDAPPAGYLYWTPGAERQLADAETLRIAKDAAWSRIKAARAATEYRGFDCAIGGHTLRFDSDAENQRRLQGAVAMAQVAAAAGQQFAVTWTLADNSTRSMSGVDLIAAGVALAAHVTACFDRGRDLRAQIEAATTKAELDAIVW